MTEEKSLPEGWVWTIVSKIAKINDRDAIIRDLPDDFPVTFVPMAAVDGEHGIITKPEERNLKEMRKGYTPFSEGDVIFAKITPCMENGKTAIAQKLRNGRGFGSTEFHVLHPTEFVTAKWIYHFVRQENFRRDAKAHFTGTAGQLRVPGNFFNDYPIPLPPLSEQERIVARIEELFTQLDAGVEALRRVQAELKRYKASLLKAACEGRLVPQDPSDEPAEELLRRLGRQSSFDMGISVLPTGWSWTTVGNIGNSKEQIVLTGPFGSTLGRKDFLSSGVPVLTIGCLTELGLSLDKAKYVAEDKAKELHKYRVREGDVLFSRMATVGRAGLVTKQFENQIINYHLMRLRLSSEIIDPDYFISYVRGASAVQDYVKEVNHGATRDGINTEQLLALPIALPPIEEQRRIVAEVESRLSVVVEVEATVEEALFRSAHLRQAILKQAFEGRLV